MIKQALGLCVAAGLLAMSTGCGICRPILYGAYPCPDCGKPSPAEVGPACEEAGPGCGHGGCLARHHGAACDDGGARCGTCGGCGVRHYGPLTWLFLLFEGDTYPDCGCDRQRYWGDWCSSPPDYCDPCDQCGHYTGRNRPGAAPETVMAAPSDMAKAAKSGRSNCPTCGGTGYANGARQKTSAPASQDAPRIISQTDRVVKPATAAATSPDPGDQEPRIAMPQRITTQR